MENLKKKKKVRVWFMLDEDIYVQLEEHIKKDDIDKSKLMQHLVDKYLDKLKK